jgi:hypothetical protein
MAAVRTPICSVWISSMAAGYAIPVMEQTGNHKEAQEREVRA